MFKKAFSDTRTLALIAIMTAVTFALTYAVRIPTPIGGFIHLGDAAVLFTGFAFGPVVGMIAGGLGTALTDVAAGYGQWMPFTLVIHGLMGFIAGYIVNGHDQIVKLIVASVISGVILVLGYLVAGWIIFGAEAVAEIPANILQIVGGGIVAVPLYYAVRRAYPPLIWQNNSSS